MIGIVVNTVRNVIDLIYQLSIINTAVLMIIILIVVIFYLVFHLYVVPKFYDPSELYYKSMYKSDNTGEDFFDADDLGYDIRDFYD